MMSQMDLMADKVNEKVEGGMSVETAIDQVSRESLQSREDIKWAYREKYER